MLEFIQDTWVAWWVFALFAIVYSLSGPLGSGTDESVADDFLGPSGKKPKSHFNPTTPR